MDDLELEGLAVKEIIEEIERQKRKELESRRPPPRHIRPNKRFLGRTIVSVLQHNRRQYAQEKRNSFRKLRELDRKRRSRSRSRSKERKGNRVRSPARYHPEEADAFTNQMHMDLAAMVFLNNMNQMLNNAPKVPKKQELKKKKKNKIPTIDLTKKKKRANLRKRKKTRDRQKTIKSKKRRRRKDSSDTSDSSSSSSSSSSSILCSATDSDSESSSNDCSQSSTLLIDLT